MGLADRKPILPAPTESLVDESPTEEPEVVEEAATDLSQRTDRTHHTIPEDGSPITISTKELTSKVHKASKSGQTSQTSLLIEYFEGGKGSDPNRRPSVRVKVVPSSKNKNRDTEDGRQLLAAEAREGGPGKRSTSRRISLSSSNPHYLGAGESDVSILHSLHIPDPTGSEPLDIDIQQNGDRSEMSSSPEARYIVAPSDISSMPADSMLGMQQSTLFAPPPKITEDSNISSLLPDESVVGDESEIMEPHALKPPVVPRDRNLSNERLTQKVIEKLSNKPRPETVKIGYGQSSKSSSRSASRDVGMSAYDRTAVKAKNFRETDSTFTDPTEPSVLSVGGKSDFSARSAATNNSINNPKLLQTVEDAIRRLILPELKELKKDQRHHSRPRYDKDYSDLSESSVVREKSARRSVSGEKTRRRRSSKDHAEHSGSRRRKGSHRDVDYDSLSDTSSRLDASISSASADDPKHHKSHRTRDMAAAGLVGAGLTAAALESRDSEESLQRRRRRKRSKSRSSRSASIAESDEIFHKHKVPPMPMQSDINSELTRSSILSSNTEMSHAPLQRDLQDVARGSAREVLSPVPNAPLNSGDLRNTLGMHHGNFSEHNLSSQKLAYDEQEDDEALSPETERYHSFSAEDLLEDPEIMRQYERNLHTQHPIRRGLSPIQSVASYQTTEPNRNSMARRSADSLASTKRRQQQLKEEVSISSFQSPSPDLKKQRPYGISLENRSEIMAPHDDPNRSPEFQSIGVYDRSDDDGQHSYRDSYATDDRSLNDKRLSGMTDSEVQYVDKVTAGQHVVPVPGAKAQIVPVPFGVESGVASLVDPSVVSVRDSEGSKGGSFVQERPSNQSLPRELAAAGIAGPHKDQSAASMRSDPSLRQPAYAHHQVDLSPPQSPARSYEDHQQDYIRERSGRSHSQSPLPKDNVDAKGSPESEITTNPSVIQGPIGGLSPGHPDPWMPEVATPPMPSHGGMSRDFSSGAIDLIPEGLNVNQRHTHEPKPHTYVIGSAAQPAAAMKDEGYATGEGDNYSPAPLMKSGPTGIAPYMLDDDFDGRLDDPFTAKRNHYVSGLSQGMSPLYDGATGKGIDRIQNNDIVALMQHLTVRDAQRNARDTEILVTLVRSAADMRNSFEEMKQFIAEQDAMIMQTADKQHAETQKVIGGPRQMPAGARAATTRSTSQEDLPTKRRNVFKRALQGLGSKNTAELQNIESMLMQLLDEVEGLRAQQAAQMSNAQPRKQSITSEDNARPPTDTGYEPEGRAGTASSRGDTSAFFSNNSSRQGHYSAARRVPENRVSTVMEGDEEFDEYNISRQMPGNQHTSPADENYKRGQPEPLHTPPGMHDGEEITPTSYESSDKKHRTFSSFLPKQFVSRWSKTTASTEPEYHQGTQSKPRPYSQVSRSGSNIQEYEYEHGPDDRLRSATSLQDEYTLDNQENRPPSPLVPSAVSDNPKYQAHRNSQNLQHPQPRQGPTGRYQYRLENAAQSYHNDESVSPVSQVSSHRWDNVHAQQQYQRHSLSPISDHQRSGSASSLTRRNNGPPRPPKIADTASDLHEPLFPQRPPKVPATMSPSTYVDDVRAARAGSPAFDKSPVGALRNPNVGSVGRKPSGPRPLSASSNKEQAKRTRFVGAESPTQSIGSEGERY